MRPEPGPEPYPVPSGVVVRGRLTPPPSKSVAQRYLALALVSRRRASLRRLPDAVDVRHFLAALERLGWGVGLDRGSVRLTPPGRGAPSEAEIDCGAGGTMLRLLTAALCAVPGSWELDGTPRLRERPVGALAEALEALGARIDWQGEEGFPPLVVHGGTLVGGRTRIDAGESSQYLSALLIAAQAARDPVAIEVEALTSAPYVELTCAAIRRFGGAVEEPEPGRFSVAPGALAGPDGPLAVEGDYSAACYPAAAAALTGGRVRLDHLEPGSAQGDRGFLALLEAMGARVSWAQGELTVEGAAAGGGLTAVDVDLGSMPDQVPTLAAIAPFARGTTRIRGVPHLRIKESDRLAAMASELGRLGAEIEERPDGLVIPGVWAGRAPPPQPVTVDSHDDHRIAMSLALTGLCRPGVSVANPRVVAKSYPGFWQDLRTLTGSS